MNTLLPKKINPRWLQRRRTVLECTAKTTHEGLPNPNYDIIMDEVNEATEELARWNVFESWMKSHLGMIMNQYPLKTIDGTYEPMQVFFRKDKSTGRVEYLTRMQAWEKFLSHDRQSGPS